MGMLDKGKGGFWERWAMGKAINGKGDQWCGEGGQYERQGWTKGKPECPSLLIFPPIMWQKRRSMGKEINGEGGRQRWTKGNVELTRHSKWCKTQAARLLNIYISQDEDERHCRSLRVGWPHFDRSIVNYVATEIHWDKLQGDILHQLLLRCYATCVVLQIFTFLRIFLFPIPMPWRRNGGTI